MLQHSMPQAFSFRDCPLYKGLQNSDVQHSARRPTSSASVSGCKAEWDNGSTICDALEGVPRCSNLKRFSLGFPQDVFEDTGRQCELFMGQWMADATHDPEGKRRRFPVAGTTASLGRAKRFSSQLNGPPSSPPQAAENERRQVTLQNHLSLHYDHP